MTSRIGSTRARAALLMAVVAAVAMAIPAVSEAKKRKRPTVTVMTRNVFLGADLSPAIGASSIPQAIDGAGQIWNEMQSTRFAERAVPLAREIKRSKADLVGLQEVALWRKQTPSDGGSPPISPLPSATPATAVEQDFLAMLRRELKRQGAKYRVVVVQREFDAELPVDVDGSDATGTGPLAVFGADFDARLTMRDVILARKGGKLRLGKTRKGHFDTRYEPNVGGVTNPVDRGWASVEAAIRPGDDLAFRVLANFGMRDNGAVQSCCYDSLFDPAAVFDHTVDHVLTKPGLVTRRARVTGDDPQQRTPSGLWPSDHGGVVSTLRLKR